MKKKMHHFLMKHETGIHRRNGSVEAWVHVSYNELQEFLDIVEPQYEFYPHAELQEDSLCVTNLLELLDDEFEEYKDCFDKDDWERAFEVVL